MDLSEIQSRWPQFKESLKHDFDEILWSTHLESLEASAINNDIVSLTVLSQFSRDFLQNQYLDQISCAWQDFFGDDYTLRIETRPDEREQPEESPAKEPAAAEMPPETVFPEKLVVPAFSTRRHPSDMLLDPSLTFDSYVPDISSQVAFAAARAISTPAARFCDPPMPRRLHRARPARPFQLPVFADRS